MLTVGVFFAGLLAYGLFSRVLDRRSITPQIIMLALGVGLGLAVRGTPEMIVDTELLGVAGEAALILALTVDAARIDIAGLRRSAGLPIRLLAIGLPLTIVAGTVAAVLVLPGNRPHRCGHRRDPARADRRCPRCHGRQQPVCAAPNSPGTQCRVRAE